MLSITLGCPRVGMGVFTCTFSISRLLISTICLPVADVTDFIPGTSGAIEQIVATPSVLTSEFGYGIAGSGVPNGE